MAALYVDNASGATKDRPELRRLLNDAHEGDIILLESVDRLSRLTRAAWNALRQEIDQKGLRGGCGGPADLSPGSLQADEAHEFTGRMLDAVNEMMLDVMAAVARKDYEQRRVRQRQGIEKAKTEGKFTGRPKDQKKRKRIAELLDAGFSIRKAAEHANASTYTVQMVKKERAAEAQ